MSEDLLQVLDQQVKNNDVVLYMKGTPSFPRCGFSGTAAQILKVCGVKRFLAVDMLQNPELVQPLTVYASWPTLPALFIRGEFIGGCDIMRDMYQEGELQKLLEGLTEAAAPA